MQKELNKYTSMD